MDATTNTRALDAKLHELLTGEKCWHVVGIALMSLPDGDTWVENDWATNKPYGLVPNYHDDLIAMHAAETALPVELQGEYADMLDVQVLPKDSIIDWTGDTPYVKADALFMLIHASAEQRATAMIAVLERAKEAKK